MSAESSGKCSNSIRRSRSRIPNASAGGTSTPSVVPSVVAVEEEEEEEEEDEDGRDKRSAGASGASSSGLTSTPAKSHPAHLSSPPPLSLSLSLPRAKTVPRMTCGRAAAAFFSSSSRFARFFCLVRRAWRFRADSTPRTDEVWKPEGARARERESESESVSGGDDDANVVTVLEAAVRRLSRRY